MQIFATSADPIECARYLDNKRVVKMAVESLQILSTAMWLSDIPGPYKPTHAAHPCIKWVLEHPNNFAWLCRHARALLKEYFLRYGKFMETAEQALLEVEKFIGGDCRAFGPPQSFVNCTTHHKHIEDTHLAYKLELFHKWGVTDKRTSICHIPFMRHQPNCC